MQTACIKNSGEQHATVTRTQSVFLGTPSHTRFLRTNGATAGGDHLPGRNRVLQTPCPRSEEHTSELQSRENLVCRLLLEKKKKKKQQSRKEQKKTTKTINEKVWNRTQ